MLTKTEIFNIIKFTIMRKGYSLDMYLSRMKNKIKMPIAASIALVLLLSFISCGNNSIPVEESAIPIGEWYRKNPYLECGTDAYDYSLLPDYPDECTLSRYGYYDVPQEQVDTMSTQGLVITCVEYPLEVNLYFFDTYYIGYRVLKNKYTALRELCQRDNAAEILAAFYGSISYDDLDLSQDATTVQMRFLEMIIADDEIVDKADESTRKLLIKEGILKAVDDSQNHNNDYGTNTTLFMISKYLYKDSAEFKEIVDSNSDVYSFVTAEYDYVPNSLSDEVCNLIIDIAMKYIE